MENFEYLPKLHACQLLIGEEIKRLCEKHGIRYFMIAGTLLGAVRHGGAIPWDDDMDIGMLREDYERFLQVAATDLDERFFLQTTATDPHYGLPFAKVLLCGTVLTEANGGSRARHGIFVDVFPFDVAPEDEDEAKRHDKRTYFYKRLLLAKRNYQVSNKGEYVKKTVYFLLSVLALFWRGDKLCAKLDAEITRYNGQTSRKIVNIGGAYGYKKETILREWVEETVDLPFDGSALAAPAQYKAYLEAFYGDYMTPPPEDKRYNRHSVTELDFGNY